MSKQSRARNGLRAVVFDMDDTLISRRDAFRRYAEAFYDAHPAMHDTPRPEAVARLAEWDGRGDNDKALFFGRVKAKWPNIPESIPELTVTFWDELTSAVRADKESLHFLDDLTRARVPWGIVTNGADYQYTKMMNVQLNGRPPFAIVSKIFGHDKPHPAVFREAVRRLGCLPEQVLFVGDNPRTDIRGAQGAGLRTAWMRAGRDGWRWGDPAPEYQLDHVRELRDVLL